VISGIVPLFYYVPTVDHAYDSVSYLRTQVPFGWLVHNMHYWGANAMVLLVALHMIRVYIWAAYKTQLTWLIGVTLLLLTMAMSFTGAPLIWDQRGYWAGEVGSGITGTVPIMGDLLKTILRGGEVMGQLAISRFFIFHVGVFTPLLMLMIGVHVASFRKSGVVGPWDESKRKHSGPFWPDQAFKDAVTGTIVFFILITLSVFSPPTFSGPADVLNTTYLPKPEWNFLFLYQALKYFKGPLEPAGTVGVPAVLIALLVLLPFIDRNPERNPLRRPIAMACLVAYAGLILALTIIGYLSPGYAEMPAGTEKGAFGMPGPRQVAPALPGAAEGARLFRSEGCIGCHSVEGTGGKIGPALSATTLHGRDRRWITDQIRNPKSHNPKTVMPSFASLTDQQVNDLVDYLIGTGVTVPSQQERSGEKDKKSAANREKREANSRQRAATSQGSGSDLSGPSAGGLPGPAAYIIGDADNGSALFGLQCAACHGQQGKSGISNPGSDDVVVPSLNPIDREFFNAEPLGFAENIDRIIQHGSLPQGPHPGVSMPAWGDSHALTQQEIANVEAYILKLNGVDRARLINPGMKPLNFYLVVVAVYMLFILVQGGIRIRKNIS
jgi:ubiquinol-cytochrome c reductase cytochrome b subunit